MIVDDCEVIGCADDTVLAWGAFSVNAVGSLVLGPPAGLGAVGVEVAFAEVLWV